MDRYIACLGLISCLVIGMSAIANVTISVSKDVKVMPTPNPSRGPEHMVNVTLECAGSNSNLAYYIKNRMQWQFKDFNQNVKGLTQSFYEFPKSEYAHKNFQSGHLTSEHGSNKDDHYAFYIVIVGVTAADDGVYRCTLLDPADAITDTKDVRLTVVNPVTSLSIELHDENHNLVVQSNAKLTQDDQPIKIAPGKYMVSCSASGSNPEPVMELFYNADKKSVSAHTEKDSSADTMSYKGSVPMMPLTINAQTSIQALTCRANIAGGYYESQEAALALMVQVNKPNVDCENATAAQTDKHTKLTCVISSPGNNDALECAKVNWLLSNKGVQIGSEQRWKDPEKVYDIMEGQCQKTSNGLNVYLDLYTTTPAMYEETFFVVYGTGQNAHRHAVILHDVTIAAAGIVTPLSLLVSLAVALVSKHLANL